MHRRTFLKALATLPALASVSGRLFAAPVGTPYFLLVFLRGGYDCNHLLVPYASDFYYQARPTLALPRPSDNADASLRLDDHWALAPSLREHYAPMYRKRQLAFVPFAGTGDLSRSHFETQDHIERGFGTGAGHDQRSGFMARLAGVLDERGQAIAFTRSLPLSFEGGGDIPNLALSRGMRAGFNKGQSAALERMYADTSLADTVREGMDLRRQAASDLQQEMQRAGRGAIDPNGFAGQTRRIATLMRDRFRLGFVDVGGWDTHVGQGGADGALARRLNYLSSGLAAFAESMGPDWNRTVVAVVSEFGRTFRENGNGGTDHGHGTVYTFLGGAVRGGRILGNQLDVVRANLLQDRDYRVLNNDREVLGGLFARLWGLSRSQTQTIFPDAAPRDLGLV
ncbi:DUF1501 domain-containing protein [Oleiagrimonas sp.]|jgi:uncharacterized protein (DUF1501 family)|uniref:DUF1501 domain-containing protein n=1 Tax=Oleiagrimonas sp. TaxID=2010330 RepID=UPI00261E9DD5|nr:DUF1501 domain-containing protein [Oleiagrimonas sp.]MDA3912813.1 DUF1501 domain-containing protein [Oleiagrimonas sp.]